MSAGRDDSPSSSSTFYDGEELHCDWHQSTLPSEDIWKKFELLPPAPDGANSTPTPPPSGDPSREGGEVASRGHVWDPAGGSGMGAVGAVLLRDCMWSSAASSARATPGRLVPADKLAPPPPAVSRAVPSPAAAAVPAKMLPFEPGGRHLLVEGREDGETVVGGAMSPGNETLGDSDDDDDADEEDGEIDVVTVEEGSHTTTSVALRAVHDTNTAPRYNDNNRRQRRQQRRRPAPPASTPPVHQQQHNYATPSPPARGAKTPPPPAPRGSARSRGAAGGAGSSRAVSTGSGGGPRSSGGSEGLGERHNDQERRRRDSIKKGFQWLRGGIPELAHDEKAAKAQILKRAIEYSRTLKREEERLRAEKRREQIRRRELLARLETLKNSLAERRDLGQVARVGISDAGSIELLHQLLAQSRLALHAPHSGGMLAHSWFWWMLRTLNRDLRTV
ncbi:N-myc proto-oncogene protein-like [Lethenteron reissneri]|uniref:N-myc proto-oncogene protein-like n=1 Tax=Lethenteron reissneri TaxID=7753 RepID=UPI002AB5EDCE|nr:N-myc proto-oncogene protein-like [Lethenteron reissneri]XP_061437521.1 N-myc proto-oncogene protein-like [Lethenteron reissneri]